MPAGKDLTSLHTLPRNRVWSGCIAAIIIPCTDWPFHTSGLPWLFYWDEMFAVVVLRQNHPGQPLLQQIFQMVRPKFRLVYNGIDFSAYPGHLPVSQKGTTPRFFFVGRLDTPKDPSDFFSKRRKSFIGEYPDAKFTMVGDGEKYGECVALSETMV